MYLEKVMIGVGGWDSDRNTQGDCASHWQVHYYIMLIWLWGNGNYY